MSPEYKEKRHGVNLTPVLFFPFSSAFGVAQSRQGLEAPAPVSRFFPMVGKVTDQISVEDMLPQFDRSRSNSYSKNKIHDEE
jgi:hypothetical protein